MATKTGIFRVAVDAMGGDNAPGEVVAGAVQAARLDGIHVVLVGDPAALSAELAKNNITGLPITMVPSEGVIQENEPPALALRQKPHASILVATSLVKKGMTDASVSMGSTGAGMAAAAVILGVFEGVERPCLGGPIIGLAPKCIIIDLGTNVDCKPAQLLNFAVIGSVFSENFWGVTNPRVALISVGAETGKGNQQVKETTKLLSKAGLNFIGNIEANDLPMGKADVAVGDGFVGNIVMKLTEGLGMAMSQRLRERFQNRVETHVLEEIARDVYEVHNVLENLGGGPLLGVNGISVIGHGRGTATTVRNAILTARHATEIDLVPKLKRELARVQERLKA